MHAGVNAIEAAYVLMERFRAYEDAMNRAEHRHPAFAGDNHPINVNFGTLTGGEWNSSVATRATTIASSSNERLVDRGSRGPAGRSPTVSRAFHLATVFGLMP